MHLGPEYAKSKFPDALRCGRPGVPLDHRRADRHAIRACGPGGRSSARNSQIGAAGQAQEFWHDGAHAGRIAPSMAAQESGPRPAFGHVAAGTCVGTGDPCCVLRSAVCHAPHRLAHVVGEELFSELVRAVHLAESHRQGRGCLRVAALDPRDLGRHPLHHCGAAHSRGAQASFLEQGRRAAAHAAIHKSGKRS